MGTRFEDQPADHWAGPESLDPTPVWKQYLLVALLLFGGLIAVLVVSLLAILPQIVTPPALVPGDRLVLSLSGTSAAAAVPQRIGPPLVVERSGDMRNDVTELTRLLAREFEAYIASAPTDWHMLQPAWEELPVEPS